MKDTHDSDNELMIPKSLLCELRESYQSFVCELEVQFQQNEIMLDAYLYKKHELESVLGFIEVLLFKKDK